MLLVSILHLAKKSETTHTVISICEIKKKKKKKKSICESSLLLRLHVNH